MSLSDGTLGTVWRYVCPGRWLRLSHRVRRGVHLRCQTLADAGRSGSWGDAGKGADSWMSDRVGLGSVSHGCVFH